MPHPQAPPSHSLLLPAGNRLLTTLMGRDRQRVLARCQMVELDVAQVLCRPGERMRHVFFPLDSCISQVAANVDSASIVVALVGEEGMLGAALTLGQTTAQLEGQVHCSGSAWRMDAKSFLQELQRSQKFRRTLENYLCVMLSQLAQATTCTRFHLVEARLARLLLMSRDRVRSNGLTVTHERLAASLGVRRVGISLAAKALQSRSLIRYRRGSLLIRNGRGLEAAACECYAADNSIYHRLMR